MASKALVGPLRFIHFGAWGNVRQAYDVPRDTRDLRAAACFEHHPACDCREAELNEQINEYWTALKALRAAAETVLRGHRLHDYGDDQSRDLKVGSHEWKRFIRGDGPLACQCTGCQLIRATHEYVPTDRNGVVE